MTKKKKIIISVSSTLIIIVTILFSLAYRYLLEREETPISATSSIATNTYLSSGNTDKSEADYDDWS